MSVVLKIEFEISKESSYVYNRDGTFSGASLENFLIGLSAYYSSNQKVPNGLDELNFFLPVVSKISNLELLSNVWYEGDWDYQDNEYEKFLVNSPNMPLPQDEFEKCIHQMRDKWTNPFILLEILIQLQDELLQNPIEDTWFFDQKCTMADLSALISALQNLKLDKNERIRLKFC